MPATENAAHLHLGPGIKLKGEIVGCDMMRIEGTFDGTATARQLVLCPGGTYLGTAQIEEAEIEGTFEGTLNVRGRLFLRSTGRISGTFTYGQLEIERGGEIAGQIAPHKKVAEKPHTEIMVKSRDDGPAPSPRPFAPVPQTAAPVAQLSQPADTAVAPGSNERLNFAPAPAASQATSLRPARPGYAVAQAAPAPRLSAAPLLRRSEGVGPELSAPGGMVPLQQG